MGRYIVKEWVNRQIDFQAIARSAHKLTAAGLAPSQIIEAKERFVDELKQSGLDYCIIRPSGFFSDMAEFFNMANSGRVYLFGDGKTKVNPIHGADLAKVCVDAIFHEELVIEVGDPEVHHTLSEFFNSMRR